MQQQLGIVAIVLAICVAGLYGWRLSSDNRPEPPEKLVRSALTSDTPKQREIAAIRLTQCGKPVCEQLVRVFSESTQPEVKAACIRGLGTQWYYRAMPELLNALDDDSSLVREQASGAVQHLLRVKYEFFPDHPPEKRREVVNALRAEWEEFQQSRLSRAFMREKLGGDL